jgi:hypothetical protein
MVGTIAYLASLPLSFASFRRREQAEVKPAGPPAPE